MSQPLVSVIVPNYNHARYLEQRLDCIFGQTYTNFEVIILDDKSTDYSLEVISRYKDNPHLSQIVVNEVNSGSAFKQWDKGVSLAKGEYVWIAESDDYCELNMLEELVAAIYKHHDVIVAFSSYVMFSDDGYLSRSKNRRTQYYNGLKFTRGWMSLDNAIMNASGAIFRRDAYYNLPSKDFMEYRGSGDWLFWCQIAVQGEVAFIRKNLTYFRLSPSTVTAKNRKSGNAAIEDRRVIDYIDKTYHLSACQRYVSNVVYKKNYEGMQSRFGNACLWLVNFMRRHFGVLIP